MLWVPMFTASPGFIMVDFIMVGYIKSIVEAHENAKIDFTL